MITAEGGQPFIDSNGQKEIKPYKGIFPCHAKTKTSIFTASKIPGFMVEFLFGQLTNQGGM